VAVLFTQILLKISSLVGKKFEGLNEWFDNEASENAIACVKSERANENIARQNEVVRYFIHLYCSGVPLLYCLVELLYLTGHF